MMIDSRPEQLGEIMGERLDSASRIARQCAMTIENAIHLDKASYVDGATFQIKWNGRAAEVSGYEHSTNLANGNSGITIKRRRFVDPREDEERTAYIVEQSSDRSRVLKVNIFMSRGSAFAEEVISELRDADGEEHYIEDGRDIHLLRLLNDTLNRVV